MRFYRGVLFGLCAFVAGAIISGQCRANASEADPEAVVKSANSFAVEIYSRLKEGDGNLFFAPYSITNALAMTYAGSRETTEAQMAKTLHLSLSQQRLHAAFGTLMRQMTCATSKEGCRLNVVNALWGQKGFGFLKDYEELISKDYGGRLIELDFQKSPEESRSTINHTVEKQTEGRIVDLLPAGLIDAQTRLVLTNAVYFKGVWDVAFAKDRTKKEDFTLLDGSKVQASMMHHTGRYGYVQAEGFQILEMPYKGSEVSMVVFLPKDPAGLDAFEKSATVEKIHEWLGNLKDKEIAVSIPRFRITTPSYQLGKNLVAMGMTDAFNEKADFSGINGRKDLCLKDVLHKAFVDVNEEGTEAAAATAVVAELKAALPSSLAFRADHPFMFLIRHNPSKCIVFMGRLTKP